MVPRIIFQAALKAIASSIIATYNHPSGNRESCQSDIALTEKLRNAGTFLDIQVLDHLILTSEAYFSFADDELL